MNPWLIASTVGALILIGCNSNEPTSTTPSEHTVAGAAQATAPKQQSHSTPTNLTSHIQENIIGKVGKHLLTDKDIDRAFTQMPANFQKMKANPAMRANILNNLLTRLALTDKAQQLGIANDPDIRGKIERAQSSILLQALNKRQRNKLATSDDKRLKAYYNANRPRFTKPEQLHVRHIVVKSDKLANKLLHQLQKGADFAKLAKQYSEDSSSKARGGDIGSFPRGHMAPPFEQAAFALKKNGALAGPVKTRFGFHIIERLGYTPATIKPFDQVKNEVINEIQQQDFRNWVEGVKKEMGLTILDPRYQHGTAHHSPPTQL